MRTRIGILAALVWLGLAHAGAAQVPQMPPQGPPGGAVPAGPGRISGVVKSAEGQALATVGITLRSAADSGLVTGVLTDAGGRFRIEGLLPGRYMLRVSTLGYKPRNSEVIEVTLPAPHVDLGTIELEVSAVALDAIEAAAERDAVVIEADRTTYNVKAMPVASTGTAVDVLRAVPELEVDVNNNVKLRGNQAVAVHLNGRPAPLRGEQLANFLQQLPGNRVDRVEVLPNPSAKHDPEGMGGIVNIVLKDNLDLGLSGSLNATVSTQNRRFFNGRLNYQRGRLTLFSGAGISTYRNESWNYDLRRNLVTQPVTVIEQNSSYLNQSLGWNLDWTAELKVGQQAHLWSNAWMYSSGSDADGSTGYEIRNDALVVRDSYDRVDVRDMSWGNYNVGGGFKQIFQQQKEELTVDGRVSLGGNDQHLFQEKLTRVVGGEVVDIPLEYILNDIDAGDSNLSVQADYFRPLGAGKIELGLRSWRRAQDNENQLHSMGQSRTPTGAPDVHSGYDYAEFVQSLYTTVSRTFGRFGTQMGLRLEHTSTDFESRVVDSSFDRSYTSLFPSFNVSYTPKPGRSARLLFSRRIGRPAAWYLDPFVPTTDPLSISLGNPDLKPTYTNSFSLDFSYTATRGTLRIAPYYRRTSNIWERIRTVDEAGVATNRWLNGRQSESLGSTFTLSLRPMGRLSGSTNFNVWRESRDGTNIASDLQRSATLWSVGGNLGLKVTQTLTAQAFATQFPPQSILQGRATGYTFSSLALRQQVWGTKGSISLNVQDPLNLSKFNSSSSHATYTQTSRSSFQSRMATLGVTYNFGKPPQQQSRRSGQEESGETIRVR
jgi:ferric enterobactin receptor